MHDLYKTTKDPPGRNLYPKGLTRQQIEDYVTRHPEQKDAIYSPYTVIHRHGWSRSRDCCAKPRTRTATEPFASFLRMRAAEMLNDEYHKRTGRESANPYRAGTRHWAGQVAVRCACTSRELVQTL